MSERMIDATDVEVYTGPGSLCWIAHFGFAEHLADGTVVEIKHETFSGWIVIGPAVYRKESEWDSSGWYIPVLKDGWKSEVDARRIRIEGRSSNDVQ